MFNTATNALTSTDLESEGMEAASFLSSVDMFEMLGSANRASL